MAITSHTKSTYLLICNSEFPLGLFIIFGKGSESLDRFSLEYRQGEYDVRLSIFVTGLLLRVSIY
jgi:hypothetical protein